MVGRPSRHAPPRPRRRRARLCLERLEDRSLLAVGALAPAADHLLITTRDGEQLQVRVEEGLSAEDALASYSARPDVQFAEVDWTVSASAVPDDTRFGDLYGLRNTGQSGGIADADIDATEAWDVTTGGLSIVVAVIDSGVDYRHRDLYKNIWLNQREINTSDFVDTDGDGLITFWDLNESDNAGKVADWNSNGYIDGGDVLRPVASGGLADGQDNDGNGKIDDLIGWDFVNNDNNPLDDNGHGTHVAGTIGAMGNNSLGVAGVNWQVQIAALKFLGSSGSGSISNARAALDYAVSMGIPISNNSWSGGGYSSSFNTSLAAARNSGHIFVAAAGNEGRNNDTTPSYPASYTHDNVIAVAATDRRDALASFSNYGRTSVDIGAPGASIVSTTPNNGYASYSGTSMAAPHVAGVVALVWGRDSSLTYDQVIARVLNTGDAVNSLTSRTATGARLNAYNAVSVVSADVTGPYVVAAEADGTLSVSSVRVTFSEAIDPATFTAEDVIELTGPGGPIVVTGVAAVEGSGNTQFDITFETQTAEGAYSFTLGTDIADGAGNLMDQNQNGSNGEADDAYWGGFAVGSGPESGDGSGSAYRPDDAVVQRGGLAETIDRPSARVPFGYVFPARRDTEPAPAVPEELPPRPDGEQEARELAFRGLVRRARAGALGWSLSWDDGAEA